LDNAILLGFALAAAAGLNAFIPLLVLGLADRISTTFDLGRPYDFLSSSAGIIIVLTLLTVEIVVDKIPRADHVNDLIHSAIRPAAGAFIFMAAVNEGDELNPVIAMMFGLLVAGVVHWYKTLARPAITIKTRGVANPFVSMIEDFLATTVSVIAVIVPLVGAVSVIGAAFILRKSYRWAVTGFMARNQ
jgi:hypothetical protein